MKLKDKLNYFLLCAILYPLSVIPLRLLYIISDIIGWLAHDVVRYRRKVIYTNLRNSFPDKSEKELHRIGSRFYRWLGDYGMETVKLLTASDKWMSHHLTVVNPEVVNDATARNRNVILFLGHYCNWEWVSSLPLVFDDNAVCAQVYHPLHNKGMDRIFFRLRTRFHAHNIPMKDIMRFLIEHKRKGVPTVTGFIADQRPGMETHLFLDFLNQDTAVFTGPERIAGFLDAEVFYCHLSRPVRGRYELRFIPVTDKPKTLPMFQLTRDCFADLQANILEAPQYYLWSHKRWKRTRRQFYEYWGDRADEMLSHL